MLDQFDRKILAILQKDSKAPQRRISEAVNLSPSAVNRRIAAMEEAGVIERHVAIVDPSKVRRLITIIVEVSLEAERHDLLVEVRNRFTACPAVTRGYYATAEVSFFLAMLVSDMAEYKALTRELFFSQGNTNRFHELVVMDRAKVTLEVPVDRVV